MKVWSLSCVRLFVTPGTVAFQAPLSMAFSRQEYWSGLPCPPTGDLSDPGIEARSPALQVDLYCLNYQGRHIIIIIVVIVYQLQTFGTFRTCFLIKVVTFLWRESQFLLFSTPLAK